MDIYITFENMDYFPHQKGELFKNLKLHYCFAFHKKNYFSCILAAISNMEPVIFVDVVAKTKKLNWQKYFSQVPCYDIF